MSRDPDPFEDRHPSRVDPECQYGQLLKTFFRKESFVQDLFNNYLHDKYFVRQGLVRDAKIMDYCGRSQNRPFFPVQDKSPLKLNTAALRLALDILPGLENAVLVETEGLIGRLYGWAETGEEPIRSYSTGVLAAAMEVPEVIMNAENRERNNKLVPILLSRLRQCQAEEQEEREKSRAAFKRPFSVFDGASSSSSAGPQPPSAKMARRLSRDILENEAEKRKFV